MLENTKSTEEKVTVRQRVTIKIGKGEADFVTFSGLADGKEHIALIFGKADKLAAPKVRIHSECLTGDIFGSQRCDCGPQLNEAIETFNDDTGIILYMRQEGRGIGLYNKLDAYKIQDDGVDTFEANRRLGFDNDLRDYKVAADMLKALNIVNVQLLTNNKKKINGIESGGINVLKHLKTGLFVNPNNLGYLKAKVDIDNHTISL